MAEKVTSVWQLDEFKPYAAQYQARQQLFGQNWRYYKGKAYGQDLRGFRSLIGGRTMRQLYSKIQALFTPLARAVNLDVALIPGDWALADERHQDAVAGLFAASRWDIEGDLFIRYLMAMGEAGLKVVDDRVNGRLMMQAIRPDSYLVIPHGRYDPAIAQAIFVTTALDDEGKPIEEAEVIDAAQIRTFRGGSPAGIDGRPDTYDNALGFVPLVACLNDGGEGVGEPTFEDAVPSLDRANELATYLADIIKKHAEPQWAVFGAEASDLEKSGDTVWFFPEGSKVEAILANVNIAEVMAFVADLKEEMKESLPELSLAKLVGVERVAAATIELQMSEAVFKIRRLRKAADQGVADALRLAGRAAADMGLSQFAGLNDPALAFDKARPVISVDALTRLQIEQAEAGRDITRMSLAQQRLLDAAAQGDEA